MTFLRVFAIATLAFVVVAILPLFFISTLLCWAIVVIAGWRYPLSMLEKVQQMSNPTGYAVGMGALMGGAVNFVGVIVMVIYSVIVVGVSALHSPAIVPGHHSPAADAAAMNGVGHMVGTMGWIVEAIGAPFWGAILGAFGGLIGGSQVPKIRTVAQLP
jgi:hypothetical protein